MMTLEEKAKTLKDLQRVRQEIDLVYASAFTSFVEAVHRLSLMITPLIQNQEALAYKLIEIESKLRKDLEEEDES